MRTRLLFIALFAVLLITSSIALAAAPGEKPAVSLIPINPDAAVALKQQGRPVKSLASDKLNNGNKFSPGGTVVGQLSTAAEQEIIVLFVSFTDNPPGGPTTRANLSNFDALLFGTSYKPALWEYLKKTYGIQYPADRTLYNYYQDVSYGKVKVSTGDLPSRVGWINVGHPYSYYFGDHDNGFSADPPNDVWGLVVDALTIAKSKIDFSKYAGADHLVPNVFIVVAGTGGEWSGETELMWSHSSYINWLTGGPGLQVGTAADGQPVYVNHYAMMPEVGGDLTNYIGGGVTGPYPATVGVYAHEYGHVLGLPDQYDYGYESEGTGQYSLMAGGSWGLYPRYLDYYGNSPSVLDAWSRYRLGFVNPSDITGKQHVTLRPVEQFGDVYRMVVPNSGGKEYFLFENRQQIRFDMSLWRASGGAHGLAIYHVDEVALSQAYGRPNEAENWKEFRSEGWQKASNGLTHYSISLMQADDQWSLEHGYNQGDSGDLFPGLYNLTSFGNTTFPNSSSYYFWNGSDPKFGYSGVNVFNIVEKSSSDRTCPGCITADFDFIPFH